MILPEVTTLAEARVAIRDLAEEVEKLSNELAWFRRQLFGSKTEHYIPRDDTPSLCGWPRKLDNLTWCKMPVKLT